MLTILQDLILEGGFEIRKPLGHRAVGLTNLRPVLADRYAEILGDPLGEIDTDIPLRGRWHIRGLRPGHSWKRHFVGDTGVVGYERGGKKTGANKTMGEGR